MCTSRGCSGKVVAPCGLHWLLSCVSACGGEDGAPLRSLLQVAVDLEAVVPGVGHCHVAVRREGQALGAVQGIRCRVDVGQEGP